jgi:hypothetical protein
LANNEVVFEVLIMVAVIALTVFHPGFCLGRMWATIGASTGKKDKVVAVHSSSRFRGMWATICRCLGKRPKDDNEPKLEKDTATSSAQNSKEDVTSQ